MRWFGVLFGFIAGFLLTTLATLGLNGLYRGVWLPMAWVGLIAIAFASHPHLIRLTQARPFLTAFGLTVTARWMLVVGPSPTRLENMSRLVPLLILALSLVFWGVWINRQFRDSDRMPWLPSLLMVALGIIVVSASGTEGGANPMVEFLMQRFGMDQSAAELAVVIFRKTMHFCGYGTIGLNAYFLAKPKFNLNAAVFFGLTMTFLFAAFDEFRQSMSVGRTGSIWDIGLDLIGATTFVGVAVLRYSRSQPIATETR